MKWASDPYGCWMKQKKGQESIKMSKKRPLNFLDTEFWVGEMGGTQSRKHHHTAVLHIQAIPITKDHQILIIALAAITALLLGNSDFSQFSFIIANHELKIWLCPNLMHKKKINQFQTSIMFSNQMCNQNTRFRKRKRTELFQAPGKHCLDYYSCWCIIYQWVSVFKKKTLGLPTGEIEIALFAFIAEEEKKQSIVK